MSALLNVLYLTGSFFMLEVYDRVIPSRSVPTLVGLVVVAAVLFAFQGLFEILRGRIMVRIGSFLDRELRLRVFDVLVRSPLRGLRNGDGAQPLRDLDVIRSYYSGLGPTALFDLPWMPLYLVICFAFHPLIGATATAGGALLLSFTLLTELLTRRSVRAATGYAMQRFELAQTARRNAEVMQAMGMSGAMAERWDAVNDRFLNDQRRIADVAGGLGAISRVMRTALQSAVIAVGAYLVLQDQATAGIIIASSILTARALAPVEMAIANWRNFSEARAARRRLGDLLTSMPVRDAMIALPAPSRSLVVDASVVPPGTRLMAVERAVFSLAAGAGLGIVGPSASGKSSLARLLVGIWPPSQGTIRLDGATLDRWSPEQLGPHIGYLPQDVQLYSGTVAENIARLAEAPDADRIIQAAQAAGVHEMILGFAEGYDTQIGEVGLNLSAGQRQRIGLARAIYDDPFLVVLDEPSSNLDETGERALMEAMAMVRSRGGIVIVITHQLRILSGIDQILLMNNARQMAFGPRDQVLARITRPPVAVAITKPFPLPTDAPGEQEAAGAR